jgi:putative ABC transport system substrate-binding protein
MQRRKFITLLGGAATAWPLAARAQQPALPVVGFIRDGSADASAPFAAGFRKVFANELAAKRLRLLHDLVPKAVRIAVLLNPGNPSVAEATLREVREAAPTMGLQVQVLSASTIGEIDAAFATFTRERPDALFVAGDAFFISQRVQLATLAARHKVPAAYPIREITAAGGLMSYGADFADSFHRVGVYTGRILKGAKPADLPVVQSTKFEFAINLQTARALGIEVPPGLLSIADEVIE